jgi:hypothetical protein
MAQTLDQWHAKLKKWVPSWWFENKFNLSVGVTDAVFYAAAAVFQRIEQDMEDQQKSTFYTQSPAPIIDLLGDERSVPRISGELDPSYETRVQNSLFRNVGEVILQAQIDSQLVVTPSFLIENEQYGFYDDPDVSQANGIPYFDDYWTRYLDMTKNYNWWTVIIPVQTGGVDATIMQNIISVIEQNKAFGTTYDVLYRSASDTDTND